MKISVKIMIISLISFLVLGAMYFFSYIGVSDTEVRLKQKLIAQQNVTINHYDNTFKVIAQTAQIPQEFMEQSKQAFKEIYQPLIEGRYRSEDGSQKQVLMNWIQESNPTFDMASVSKLYERLQVVIETQRNEFTKKQDYLEDIHREHTTFCSTFVNKNLFFMKNRIVPKCKDLSEEEREDVDFCVMLISSQKTETVYKTGQDNDINLFN